MKRKSNKHKTSRGRSENEMMLIFPKAVVKKPKKIKTES